jgi:hypothetical protein
MYQTPLAARREDRQTAHREYRLAEYNVLAEKMGRAVRDQHIAEVFFATAIAAFYAWAFKDGAEALTRSPLVAITPTFLAVLGFLRIWHRGIYISTLEKYTRDIEHEMFGTAGGWEKYYADDPDHNRYPYVRQITWALMLLFTILITWNVMTGLPKRDLKQLVRPAICNCTTANRSSR